MSGRSESMKKLSGTLLSFRGLFPLSVAIVYLVLWLLSPEKTAAALEISTGLFFHILLPLVLVFLFMVMLNLFFKPPQFEKYTQRGAGVKPKLLTAIAGILSSGPIYAWYPILKELRDRGAAPSLMAIFLVNRAVKPALLPVMISLLGWIFVLLLTVLTVSASFCVGFIMDRLFHEIEDASPG